MKIKLPFGRSFEVSLSVGHPSDPRLVREPQRGFTADEARAALEISRVLALGRQRGTSWPVQPRDFCAAYQDREH